ncbi:MAG: hypothetical protein FJZ58_07145 [Chlamydiae bacterium]|nr:hypothetical protein [Chlamydiota bacterium]
MYSPMLAATTGGFPQDFFMTSGWIDAFKQLYSIHPLKIDMAESFPVAEGGGIWDGLIDTTTCVITFTREVDASHPSVNPVLLTLPTNTSELIAGSGPTWNITTALQGALARNLSSAIDTNTLTLTAALGKKYFDSVKASYYQMNPAMPSQLQFIDSYSQVLHSFGNIYTLPYDDELDQSGAASYTPSTFATGSIELGSIH